MAKKILMLRTKAFGFQQVIAKVAISKLADEIKADRTTSDLVCPECKQKPGYISSRYECSCGFKASSYQKLLRVIKGTFKAVVKERLAAEKEDTYAELYKMRLQDFAKFVDATKAEHGLNVKDEGSAKNLWKLLVASKKEISGSRWVIVAFWNDTYEEKIGLLTTSISGRVILKEIVPRNLALLRETLLVDEEKISEQDVKEAEMFLSQIPEAKDEMFDIKDYRSELVIPELKEKVEEKKEIEDLHEIVVKAKAETS